MSERNERNTAPTSPDGSAADNGGGASPPPPWQRAPASRSDEADSTQTLRVGEPQHASRGSGEAAANSLDAPTSFVAPVHEPHDTSADAGTAVFTRPARGAPDSRGADHPDTASSPSGRTRGPRRANLTLKGFDPWSVLKLSLVLSIVAFVVWMVAVVVLYIVLGGMGVWDQVNNTYAGLTQGGSDENLVSFGAVLIGAAVVGLINVVLFTALATVSVYIYNLASDMVGGAELTLSERE